MRLSRLSLANRGVFCQFVVGVATISTIPLLALWYLQRSGWRASTVAGAFWPLVIAILTLSAGLAGFYLLRRQPAALVKTRRTLERVLGGELADPPAAMAVPDDVEAIEQHMGQLVDRLRTRVQEVERERADLQEQLLRAQKLDGMRTMAQGVSHDYNNLLAAILGNISIVIRNMPADFRERENALQIEASALQAVELTNQVMTYTGRTPMDRADVNVTTLVETMRDTLNVSVAKGIRIEYVLDARLPDVAVDRKLLQQAVTNLVVNAGEANADRTGTVTITTGAADMDRAALRHTYLDSGQPEGRYVFVDVADHGCGMTPAVTHKMFDPFFSTKIRGQGMGLAVVMGVVRAHQGAIAVRSRPGRGTSIRLFLPAGAQPV